MNLALQTGYWLFSDYGLAILFLSTVVTLVAWPLSRFATKIQEQESARHRRMQPEIVAAKKLYKGERQFREIEAIYKKHNYHPIKSLREIYGILVQIPLMLSALVLLLDYPPINGTSFWLIDDLSRPDALISLPAGLPVDHVNLLPFLTAVLSVAAAYLIPNMRKQSRWKTNFISLVIVILIYPLPSAVVLYWTFNNTWTFMKSVWQSLVPIPKDG